MLTRLGLYGGPRPVYGSFAGKIAAVIGSVGYVENGFVRKAVITVGGLFHLIGEEVVVLADGNVVSGKSISSTGFLTLDRKASRIHVGKRFIADMETLDITSPKATIQGLKRKINYVSIRMSKSRGILVGPDSSRIRQMKFREFEKLSSPTELFTGVKKITFDPTWASRGRIFIRQPYPLPMTILAVMPRVEIGK